MEQEKSIANINFNKNEKIFLHINILYSLITIFIYILYIFLVKNLFNKQNWEFKPDIKGIAIVGTTFVTIILSIFFMTFSIIWIIKNKITKKQKKVLNLFSMIFLSNTIHYFMIVCNKNLYNNDIQHYLALIIIPIFYFSWVVFYFFLFKYLNKKENV